MTLKRFVFNPGIKTFQLTRKLLGNRLELSDVIPLVRLSGKDPIQAERVLDAGALGIIAPMVNTPEEAEVMVSAEKYPPYC